MVKTDKNGTPLWKKAYERQSAYDSENTCRVGLKFNRATDADIIKALSEADSKQGLVKEAIRFYIANKK